MVQVISLHSRLLFLAALLPAVVVLAGVPSEGEASHATLVVNYNAQDVHDLSPGDGVCDAGFGVCSLTTAIEEANAHSGTDNIHFALGSGTPTIQPGCCGTFLAPPPITDSVHINGSTGGATRIELDGSFSSGSGLTVSGGTISTIEGLVINRFGGAGIRLRHTSDGTDLYNNLIGTNSSGTADLGNGGPGILIDVDQGNQSSLNNIIGGTAAGQRNVISGNGGGGIVIHGGYTSIQNNYIGTNAAGTAAIGNTGHGIDMIDSGGNCIGGVATTSTVTPCIVASGSGNVVSGNSGAGIHSTLATITYNGIKGNHIGLNAGGTAALGNGGGGIDVQFADIGGTESAERNVVSGNSGNGIRLSGNVLTGVLRRPVVAGNYIGLNAAGTGVIGNSGDGIRVEGTGEGVCIGVTSTGGVCQFVYAANVISGNGSDGIEITDASVTTSSNVIAGNRIGTNPAGDTDFGNLAHGIMVGGDNNEIGWNSATGRNVISGNLSGVNILGTASGNKLVNNYIGLNATGTAAVGNSNSGVLVAGDNNLIGLAGSDVNVISGNVNGVFLVNDAHGNILTNNHIGTNADGTADVGNSATGVVVSSSGDQGAKLNEIGQHGTGAGNIISGNGNANVALSGATTTFNTVAGNIIGPDINGSGAAMTNGVGVLVVQAAANNTIGPANVISDNTNGVEIADAGTTRNVVKGSKIGTNLIGDSGVPNSLNGVLINGASGTSSGNTIGPNTANDGNIIAFNGLDGVHVTGSIRNDIRRNTIHSNGGLGIDLAPDGVTPNDAVPDPDAGANNLQNFPVLTEAVTSPSSNTTIHGTVSSAANSGYNLDFFVSPSCDASGNGEGAVYLGSGQTGSDGTGVASFTLNFQTAVTVGHFVTATVTRISTPTDTSEFSACLAVTAYEPMVVDTTSDANLTGCQTLVNNDCSLRGAMNNANAVFTTGDLILFDPADFPPPPGAPGVITIGDTLPGVVTAGEDIIDGAGAGVVIDGAGEPSAFPCFFIEGSGNTIRGLQITDCTHGILTVGANNTLGPGNVLFDHGVAGIALSGNGNLVIGNKMGTNAAGSAIHPSGANDTGISVSGDGNTIGGGAAERNVISGNLGGVTLSSGAGNNVVKGNYIGTDATGTTDLGNSGGITVAGTSPGNVIGGTGPDEGNLISGNNFNGLRIFGSAGIGRPTDTMVLGNRIGTNAAGTAALGNTRWGINIEGAINSCIGGTVEAAVCVVAPGGGNLVSSNGFGNVLVTAAGATGNKLFGNFIGTDAAGTGALPNPAAGVYLTESGNTIGGPGAGEGNLIAYNNGDGVVVETGTGNAIRGNSIHSNALAAIGNYSGGNGEPGHAPPVITAVGSASGTACANCVVDVYSDSADEGLVYHGSAVADDNGNGTGDWTFPGPVVGPNVTATSTNAGGSTSEFSVPVCLDGDLDTVCNVSDNCPAWANTGQTLPSWPVPANDPDCDGFSTARETHVGTDPLWHCNANSGFNNEPDAWPTDFNDSRLTDLSDVVSMGPTFNKLQNDGDYNQRYDLDISNSVTLTDVIIMGPFWLKFCN